MREILFRGKRKKDGEWVEGNLFIPDNPDTPTQICIGTYTIRICYEIIPETVGQYTGLTDKNGKKIFEGDIVKKYEELAVVIFSLEDVGSCGCCYSEFDGTGFMAKKIHQRFEYKNEYLSLDSEVVGNIHDNPELLKGGGQND